MNEKICIYCKEPFDPSRGEGDHVLPIALFGEFAGDVRFRGCCTACNNSFGVYEQILMQATSLGYLRQFAPVRRRGRSPGTRQRGAKGSKAPQHTVRAFGYGQLVSPLTDPRQVQPKDQITICDEAGIEHHVQLFEGMTAGQLKARIRKLGIGNVSSVFCSVTERLAEVFRRLVKEVFPTLTYKALPDTEVGKSTVPGRISFEFSADADRAIGKMAFHYYLTHNQRGHDGSEREFSAIRQYLRHGGNPDSFFGQPGPEFRMPFGEDASGVVWTPSNWCHVLLAYEVEKQIVVYMRLFAGPDHIGEEYQVTLGSIAGKLILPSGIWGHAYLRDDSRADRYDGHVEAVEPERLA